LKNGDVASYVDFLVGVPAHIPARTISEMGKEGMNAYLCFGLGEIEFGPAVLLMDRVVGLNGHVRKLIAAFRYPIADREIVSGVGDQEQNSCHASNTKRYGFHAFCNPLAGYGTGVSPI
jgi:hypothetical protein